MAPTNSSVVFWSGFNVVIFINECSRFSFAKCSWRIWTLSSCWFVSNFTIDLCIGLPKNMCQACHTTIWRFSTVTEMYETALDTTSWKKFRFGTRHWDIANLSDGEWWMYWRWCINLYVLDMRLIGPRTSDSFMDGLQWELCTCHSRKNTSWIRVQVAAHLQSTHTEHEHIQIYPPAPLHSPLIVRQIRYISVSGFKSGKFSTGGV